MLHPDFNSMPQKVYQSLTSLSSLYSQQNQEVRDKIRHDLTRQPTDTDGPGFVYGFIVPTDRNLRTNFKMKLGRTAREDPRQRIKEWGGQEIFTMKSSFNIRYERLIHLFFDRENFHRPNKSKPNHEEVEWFHFKGVKQTEVVRWVLDIHDLVEELFNDTDNLIKDAEVDAHPVGLGSDSSTLMTSKVNINIATPSELQIVKWIGPVRSHKIVEFRTSHGNFKSVQDLTKIHGIGPSTLIKIQNYLTV